MPDALNNEIDLDEEDALLAQAPKEKGLGYYAKQAVAGVADMVNLPALYTVPGVLGSLAGVDTKLPGHDTAAEMANSVNNSINEFIGVDNPEGIGENIARLSSALFPARWGSLATKLPSAAPKAVQTAAKVADAIVVPGVQGKYTAPRAAANFGIPFAAGQGVEEVLETKGDPAQTVFDYLPGTEKTVPTDEIDLDREDELLRTKQQYQGSVDLDEEDNLLVDQEEQDADFSDAGIATAGAVALAVLLGKNSTRQKAMAALKKRSAQPTLAAEVEPSSVSTTAEKAAASVFDVSDPAVSQFKKANDEATGSLFDAQTTLGNHVGVKTQFDEFYNTGRLPVMLGSGEQKIVKTTPLKDIHFVYDQLDDQGKAALYDYAFALDELDGLRLNKGLKATDTSLLGGKTYRELNDIVKFHKQNGTNVTQISEMMQRQLQSLLHFQKQSGLRSQKNIDELIQAHPHYMPRRQLERESLSDLLLGPGKDMDALDDLDSFQTGSRDYTGKGRGVDYKGTFQHPIESITQEFRKTIKAAQVNNTRRMFFDGMRNAEGGFKVKGMYDVTEAGKDTIKYYVNGDARFVKVKDDAIRQFLKHSGDGRQLNSLLSGLDTMRQMKQFLLTGKYTNPKFAAISGQIWDPMFFATVLPKGRTMGGVKAPFSGLIGAVKGFKAHHAQRMAENFRRAAMLDELGVDAPTVNPIFNPIQASFWRMAKTMPKQQLEQLAQSWGEAYARTPVAAYRMMGGGTSNAWQDITALGNINPFDRETIRKATESIIGSSNVVPKQAMRQGHSDLGYYYNSLVDALHNGVRYQVQDLNLKKRPKFKDTSLTEDYITDLALVSKDVRQLLDPSKYGATGGKLGTPVSIATASMPYANVMLQATRRLYRAAKENPARVVPALSAVIAAGFTNAYMQSNDPARRQYHWQTRTPSQRSMNVYIPTSRDPSEDIRLPMEPSTALFFELGAMLANSTLGLSQGAADPELMSHIGTYLGVSPEEFNASDLSAGAKRAFGLAAPPVLGAGLAATGNRIMPDGGIDEIRGQGVKPYSDMYGNTPTRYIDGIVPSSVEEMMNSLFGNIATALVVDTLETFNMHDTGKPGQLMKATTDSLGAMGDKLLGTRKEKVNTFTTEATMIKDYEKALDDINAKWSQVQRQNMSKQNGGIMLPILPDGFDSPEQLQVFEMIRPQLDKVRRIFRDGPGGIGDLTDLKATLKSNATMSHDEKVVKERELNLKLQEIQRNYLASIRMIEEQATQQLGTEFDIREWNDNRFRVPND